MAIWTIVSEAGKFIAVLAAVAAWVLSRKASQYADFDSLYQGVLEKGIEKPSLRNPAAVREFANLPPEEKVAYETYAYVVFNVCETIADGLGFYESRRRSVLDLVESVLCRFLPTIADRHWLRKTWHPVLVAEKQLHGSWLASQKGGTRFKQEFLDLMDGIENVSL